MQSYRCVFSYAGGNTTIDVTADDSEAAVAAAASAISAGDYDRVEVWDGDTLLITKTTPRAWDALGDIPAPEPAPVIPEQPQTAPLPVSLPRRAPTLFASSLRALGLGGVASRWQRAASRKG
jgi:hypothetical protein